MSAKRHAYLHPETRVLTNSSPDDNRDDNRNVVRVPDIDAAYAVQLTNEQCELTYLDPDYAPLYATLGTTSSRGQSFEVAMWSPGYIVHDPEVVRAHFRQLGGFHGDVGAFTAWIMQYRPTGWHASIPEDKECFSFPCGSRHAPCSVFSVNPDVRELLHRQVNNKWSRYWTYVAFRKL